MSLLGVIAASLAELLEETDHAGPSQPLAQCRQAFATNFIKRLSHRSALSDTHHG
jgi:hypothetical protein